MKLVDGRILREVSVILGAAAFFGLFINFFHPHGVRVSFTRPPLPYADDELLVKKLHRDAQSSKPGTSKGENIRYTEPALVSTKQVIDLMTKNDAILIDAREPEKYYAEQIPSSINIPFEMYDLYKSVVDTLSADKWLICFCDGPPCDMGELLAHELAADGFPKVAIYAEGIEAWKTLGNSVVPEGE
ncbi:rhodanese-like domain-containing protein [candidate division KSB1 bacterium]|nr:rhodanese-like domain-containing protein [candidate division KSB1 bacterium]